MGFDCMLQSVFQGRRRRAPDMRVWNLLRWAGRFGPYHLRWVPRLGGKVTFVAIRVSGLAWLYRVERFTQNQSFQVGSCRGPGFKVLV